MGGGAKSGGDVKGRENDISLDIKVALIDL